MAKKVANVVKLQIPAGAATPAPPVGPALGQAGINIMGFTKEFNARTADQKGMLIPVVITVYEDRSFDFITKTPPAAVLLKKAAGVEQPLDRQSAPGNPLGELLFCGVFFYNMAGGVGNPVIFQPLFCLLAGGAFGVLDKKIGHMHSPFGEGNLPYSRAKGPR